MNAVTCAAWIKHDTLLNKPKKHKSIKKIPETFVNKDKNNDCKESDEFNKIIDDYDLDNYNSDVEELRHVQSLATFSENKLDPYMKDNIDSSEDEDVIQSGDSAIIVGKTHKDYHSLEVWIVNKNADNHMNTYCHHDYILLACPLSVEYISNTYMNLAAVASMSPVIQLWDLDTMNTVEPMMTLGDPKKEGHKDAVLTLSNKFLSASSNLLLSGSADGTVALWLIKEDGVQMIHKSKLSNFGKIQDVQWHPIEDSIFATGSLDGIVQVYDSRSCFKNKSCDANWTVDDEVEKILWDHRNPFNLFATTSAGSVVYYDVRMDVPVWSMDAHTPASIGAVAQSPHYDGFLLTAADEGKAKIWNTRKNPTELVSTKSYKIGSIFCACPSPENPLVFCLGGERELKIVDLKKDTKIEKYFLSETNRCVVDVVKQDTTESDSSNLPFKKNENLNVEISNGEKKRGENMGEKKIKKRNRGKNKDRLKAAISGSKEIGTCCKKSKEVHIDSSEYTNTSVSNSANFNSERKMIAEMGQPSVEIKLKKIKKKKQKKSMAPYENNKTADIL